MDGGNISRAFIGDYLAALASSSAAPGGGSSAALSGAMGAALVSMVANLTLGREKYSAHQELAEYTTMKARALMLELTDCVRKDMTAFDGVMAAFKLPKGTEERTIAVQEAYKVATSAPVETAEKCLEVMKLAEGLLHKSNVTAACDLSAAALEARAGILIALENVGVNLAAIRDEEYVEEKRAWSADIDGESRRLLDVIRAGVAEMTGGR
ncbi:MAG: cyclodeaminase/cyclohydrolase family protein [Synergistaceae bacterium]|nr:cyclodeaminase/cyclohydrolase family protein [Synergistaceae bacterium]